MKYKWQKLGLLYCPSGTDRHPKLLSHAANPLPVHIDGNVFRVFFSSRDLYNRSSIGAVDIDIIKNKIMREHKEPCFEYGPDNSFFADGLSLGNMYEVHGTNYILFMGWQNPQYGHWRGDIGRLVVKSDLTLALDSKGPLLETDKFDPISFSYPFVRRNYLGSYDMWYGSTKQWDAGNGEMLHVINHAISRDGHIWQKTGLAVPYELGRAQAFSRPTVRGDLESGYDMWFSYRSGTGESYRIGYAFSPDGRNWELSLDDAGINVSVSGWDSEMIEYPFVFDHNGQVYMLYNGNSYGKTGFGLAVLDQNKIK